MSGFVNAMDTSANKHTFTEKGQLSFTKVGLGDDLLALYFKLVRGADKKYICDSMQQIAANPSNIENLIVLVFQTRDIRGGKGERELFYWMFLELYSNCSRELMLPLLSLIPKYGSYKDLNLLWEMVGKGEHDIEIPTLRKDIIDLYTLHLMTDETLLDNSNFDSIGPIKLSLTAKWAPRESGHFCDMARELARNYYKNELGSSKKIYTKYRKLVSRLNRELNTTEIHMAGKTWQDIEPGAVSSRCLMINRDAFQNKIHAKQNEGEQRSSEMDRIICAKNFKEHLESGKTVHGAALHPNEIIKRYKTDKLDPVLEAQWSDILFSYRSIISDKIAQGEEVRNIIPVIDVSGSMTCCSGSVAPIDAAVGLGILLAQLGRGALKNRAITFSECPEWIDIGTGTTLQEKIVSTKNASWGMTTNLYSVFSLILKIAVKNKLPEYELSNMDIIILSDMQFDASQNKSSHWKTTLKNIAIMYKEAGYTAIPHIVFWNLNGGTVDFPEQSNTRNVTMVSGFSPSAAKTLLTEGIGAVKKEKKTPMDTLHEILEDERYTDIRNIYRTYVINVSRGLSRF
jgi:uncharacterized protein (UPF0297 family)